MSNPPLPTVTEDDALAAILVFLRRALDPSSRHVQPVEHLAHTTSRDLHLPKVVGYMADDLKIGPRDHAAMRAVDDAARDAAWTLCRMGVLRPGQVAIQGSGNLAPQGFNGDSFCLTAFGRGWVASPDRREWVPPGRIVAVLTPLSARFGPAFMPRVAEAAGCHRVGLHLSACVMAGAASEAILLEAAKGLTGNEGKVLSAYRGTGGTRAVLNMLVGSARADLRDSITTLSQVIGYWRNEAGHGGETRIGQDQADHALDQLVRLAQVVNQHWDRLTASPPGA